MTPALVAVGPDDPLATVAKTLIEHRVRRVLVVDGGQLVGIVSSLDVARLIAEGDLRPTDYPLHSRPASIGRRAAARAGGGSAAVRQPI